MNFLLAVPALVWMLLSALFHAGGEYFSKKWGLAPGVSNALLAILLYVISSTLWLPTLLHKNLLSIMGTAWLLLAMVSTIATGYIIFREPLSITQWIGIGLAIVALTLLGI